MTINSNEDAFEVECDMCECTQEHEKDISAEYGEDNGFMDMIQSLKDDGWRIGRATETGDWYHFCPDCNKGDYL